MSPLMKQADVLLTKRAERQEAGGGKAGMRRRGEFEQEDGKQSL